MLYSIILLTCHAISGLEWTGISFIASVSWSSDLLTSDSLQQNAIDVVINKGTCMQIDNVLNTYCELLVKQKKS